MAKEEPDARVITRLNEEEQALLRHARAVSGKNTSGVIKAALRQYAESLERKSPVEIFHDMDLLGAVEGPTDLSVTYKQHIDHSDKHGR